MVDRYRNSSEPGFQSQRSPSLIACVMLGNTSPAARNLCAKAQLQAELIWNNAGHWAVMLGFGFASLGQAMMRCPGTGWGSR